jgi:hypothetical protein
MITCAADIRSIKTGSPAGYEPASFFCNGVTFMIYHIRYSVYVKAVANLNFATAFLDPDFFDRLRLAAYAGT